MLGCFSYDFQTSDNRPFYGLIPQKIILVSVISNNRTNVRTLIKNMLKICLIVLTHTQPPSVSPARYADLIRFL